MRLWPALRHGQTGGAGPALILETLKRPRLRETACRFRLRDWMPDHSRRFRSLGRPTPSSLSLSEQPRQMIQNAFAQVVHVGLHGVLGPLRVA